MIIAIGQLVRNFLLFLYDAGARNEHRHVYFFSHSFVQVMRYLPEDRSTIKTTCNNVTNNLMMLLRLTAICEEEEQNAFNLVQLSFLTGKSIYLSVKRI